MPSTVNNVDLVPKEALNELKELDVQIASTTKALNGLLEPIAKIVTNLSKATNSVEGLRKAEDDLGKSTQQTTKILDEDAKLLRQREQLINRVNATQSIAAQEVAQYREGLRQINQEQRIQAKEALAAANSIEQLRARVASLKREWANTDMGSAKFKQLSKDLSKANADLSKAEASVGIYSRNVGNYSSAFSPLKFQVQQVARELPSLTMSAQQFFLAISNNLPMLADELGRARQEYAKLKAEGQKGIPVWKQLISSILSWQTALVVGITVITVYGKEIGAFFKQLFAGKQATIDFTNANKAMISSLMEEQQKLDSMYATLNRLQSGTREYEAVKADIINQFQEYISKLGLESSEINNQITLYNRLSEAIAQSALQKGLSQAQSDAAEEFTKKWSKAINKIRDEFNSKKGIEGINDQSFQKLRDGLMKSQGVITDELKDIVNKFNETSTVYAGDLGQTEIKYTTNNVLSYIDDMQNIFSSYNASMKEAEAIYGSLNSKTKDHVGILQGLQKQLTALQARRDSAQSKEEIESINKQIDAVQAQIDQYTNLGTITKQQAKQMRDLAKANNENSRAEAEAARELQEFRQQQSIDSSKKTYQNEKESYADRLAALEDFIEQSKNLIQMQADNEISELRINTAEKLGLDLNNPDDREKVIQATANQEALIREKMEAEFTKITNGGAEARKDIIKQEAQDRIDTLESNLKDVMLGIDETEAQLIKGEKIKYEISVEIADGSTQKAKKALEEFNKEVKKIQDDANKKRLQAAVDTAQKIFDETVNALKDGLAEEEDVNEARRRLQEALLALMKNTNKEGLEDSEQTGEDWKENWKRYVSMILTAAQDLANSLFELSLSRLEAESEANQEWTDEQTERVEKMEESGAISKEQAEARKEAIRQKSEEREKEIATKQAKIKKQQSIFNIIVDTASAIMAAWSYGPIVGAILTALIAATSAVQLATVMAEPIPQYAKGTQNHPGGLAIVGDAGRSEIVRTPGGGMYQTPATDTLVSLPKHSVVYPSIEAAMKDIDAITPRLDDAMQLLPRLNGTRHEGTVINFDVDKITSAQDRSTRVLNQILYGVNKDRANRRYYAMKANIRHTKTMN
jgi:hypothetical protein